MRLVVAAEAREFRGILQNCGPVNELGWPVAYAVAAELRKVRFVFAANGPGHRLASQVLQVAEVEAGTAGIETVISTGFCGGLDPQLELGCIVEATSVLDFGTGRQYAACSFRTSTAHPTRGVVLSTDRVAVSVKDKAELRKQTGAVAVEMEATAIALWASARSIPFYCLRAVSDTAGDAFPLDVNQMRDREGRFDRMKIVGHAMLRPWSAIPGLLKLDRHCRVAEERLGEFFANCRFE